MAGITTRYFIAMVYISNMMLVVSTDVSSSFLPTSDANLSINKTQMIITSNISTIMTTTSNDNTIITTTSNDNTIMTTPSNDNTIMITPSNDNRIMITPLNNNTIMTTPSNDNTIIITPSNDNTIMTTPSSNNTIMTTPISFNTTYTSAFETNVLATVNLSFFLSTYTQSIFYSPSGQTNLQSTFFTIAESSAIQATFSSNLFLSNDTLSTKNILTSDFKVKTYTSTFSTDIYVDTYRTSIGSSIGPSIGSSIYIVPIPDAQVLIINFEMKVVTNFSENLSDKSSDEYKKMENLIISELSKPLQNINGFINATVIRFTMGSILVQAQLFFDLNKLNSNEELINIIEVSLIRHFVNDKIGNYTLDIYSFKLNQVTASSSTSSSSFPAWLIILIIALIINIPLVLVIILLTWNLKKKRRVGSISTISSNELKAGSKHSTIELHNLHFTNDVMENIYKNEKGSNGNPINPLFYGELKDDLFDENQENNDFKIPSK